MDTHGVLLTQPALAVTVSEAAQLLRISRSKAYQLIAAGELRTIKIGDARRVPVTVLENFIKNLMNDDTDERNTQEADA